MRRNEERYPVRRGQDWGLSPWDESRWMSPSTFGDFSSSPWTLMRRMQEDMDRVFGQFFGGSTPGGTLSPQASQSETQQWAPNVDISQTDGEWCIEADLPGVNRDDIHVEVRDNHLILRAEMRQESPAEGNGEGEGRRYQRRERRYGYFSRVLPLPENVDEENIRCDFKGGVLAVHLPKTAAVAPTGRRIPISGGETERPGTIPAPASQPSAARPEQTPAQAGAQSGWQQPTTGAERDADAEEEESAMAGAKGGEKKTSRQGKK